MNIYKWLTSPEYRFFYKKIGDVQKSIWEMNFKIAKSRQVREGVRQDRDRSKESLHHIEVALKGANDDDKKKLEEEKTKVSDNVTRFERQMKMIDDQINGVPATPATEANPEGNPGQTGLLEVIASYVELREMYKSYINSL